MPVDFPSPCRAPDTDDGPGTPSDPALQRVSRRHPRPVSSQPRSDGTRSSEPGRIAKDAFADGQTPDELVILEAKTQQQPVRPAEGATEWAEVFAQVPPTSKSLAPADAPAADDSVVSRPAPDALLTDPIAHPPLLSAGDPGAGSLLDPALPPDTLVATRESLEAQGSPADAAADAADKPAPGPDGSLAELAREFYAGGDAGSCAAGDEDDEDARLNLSDELEREISGSNVPVTMVAPGGMAPTEFGPPPSILDASADASADAPTADDEDEWEEVEVEVSYGPFSAGVEKQRRRKRHQTEDTPADRQPDVATLVAPERAAERTSEQETALAPASAAPAGQARCGFFLSVFLAVLSAALISFAFQPVVLAERLGINDAALGGLAWFGLVPIMYVWLRAGWLTSAIASFVFGLLFAGHVLEFFSVVHVAAWAGASAGFAIYVVLLGLACRALITHSGRWAPFLVASAFVVGDFAFTLVLIKFPWLFLANSQFDADIWVIQVADLAGVYGVTYLLVLANGALLWALIALGGGRGGRTGGPTSYRWGRVGLPVGLTVALVAGAHGYGMWRLADLRPQIVDGPILALLQPNTPMGLTRANEGFEAVLGREFDLTRAIAAGKTETTSRRYGAGAPATLTIINHAAGQPIDLVVLPETGLVEWGAVEWEQARNREPKGLTKRRVDLFNQYVSFLAAQNEGAGWPLLINTAEWVPAELAAGRPEHVTNRTSLLGPRDNGRLVDTYDKRELAPIGEYVPFAEYTDVFERLVRDIYGDDPPKFTPGTRSAVFSLPVPPLTGAGARAEYVPKARFGVAICYESTFPELNREVVRAGAQFIVNQSNDGWFLEPGTQRATAELGQAWWGARYRAIENRIGVVRATNSGSSGFICPTGAIDHVFEVHGRRGGVAGALVAPVRVMAEPTPTFYTEAGPWLPVLAFLACAFVFIVRWCTPRRPRAGMPGKRVVLTA